MWTSTKITKKIWDRRSLTFILTSMNTGKYKFVLTLIRLLYALICTHISYLHFDLPLIMTSKNGQNIKQSNVRYQLIGCFSSCHFSLVIQFYHFFLVSRWPFFRSETFFFKFSLFLGEKLESFSSSLVATNDRLLQLIIKVFNIFLNIWFYWTQICIIAFTF